MCWKMFEEGLQVHGFHQWPRIYVIFSEGFYQQAGIKINPGLCYYE